MTSVRWVRLDVPGSDRCELHSRAGGWLLSGVAEYGRGDDAARLAYAVEADERWHTRRGTVRGTAGRRAIDLVVERTATAEWRVGGAAAPALAGLVDLDLGFTPATNLFPLRRLALAVADAADAAAAWLDDETWTFRALPQRYERRAPDRYWYESPTTGYAGLLTVRADGFVVEYPGLWRAEATGFASDPRS